jgi:sRNA-binding protein
MDASRQVVDTQREQVRRKQEQVRRKQEQDAMQAQNAAQRERRAQEQAATQSRWATTTPVDLRTLLADYADNEIRADAKYKGRSVSVTGVVGDVKKDVFNSPYVIVGTGLEFEVTTVQCSLMTSAVDRAAGLHKGDSVTARGTVNGLFFNIQLKDCEIR